jgi:hypothetical protein
MKKFSEESILLVKNWDTVRDIFEAEKQLGEDLSSLLFSMESELKKKDWWRDGWAFVKAEKGEVYISNEKWRSNDKFVVWIGVEGFVPESVFGRKASPTLYVYVPEKRYYDLAEMLAEEFDKGEYEIVGEIDHRSKNYVVKHTVRKWLAGEDTGTSTE